MKSRLLQIGGLFLSAMATGTSFAQTSATDFTASDCKSSSHTLFADLNAGKVVVICWVMPCNNCINTAKTITAAKKSYDSTNPGKVVFYLVDDYGNSTCSTLETWASDNGVMPDAIFSSSEISMANYGAAGMPKAVVCSGYNHDIFLNNNGSLTTTKFKTAVDNALVTANTKSVLSAKPSIEIFPNPATGQTIHLKFTQDLLSDVRIQIANLNGEVVKEFFIPKNEAGSHENELTVRDISKGIYVLSVQTNSEIQTAKLIVE